VGVWEWGRGNRQPPTIMSMRGMKTIQEVITLIVFMGFTLIFFREEKLAWNHLVGFGLLVAAVFFVFKKW
jgi:uncharacterized protein (DUF486 family)